MQADWAKGVASFALDVQWPFGAGVGRRYRPSIQQDGVNDPPITCLGRSRTTKCLFNEGYGCDYDALAVCAF